MDIAKGQDEVTSAITLIKYFISQRALSLRTIEQIMATLAVAIAFKAKAGVGEPEILASLCVLKIVAPEVSVKAKRGTLKFEDVDSVLFPGAISSTDKKGGRLRDWWRLCTGEKVEDTKFVTRVMNDLEYVYGIEQVTELPRIIATQIIDRFGSE